MEFKSANIIALGSILGAGFGFLTIPIITWFFSQEDIGRFSIYQVTLNLGMILITLDLNQAYVREYYEIDQKEQLLKIALLPGSLIFVITIPLLILSNFSISSLIFNINSRLMDFCIYLGIYVMFFINILAHVLRMHNFAWKFAFAQIVPKAGYLLFLGVMLYFFVDYNFEKLILINVFVLSLSLACLALFLKDDLHKALRAKLDIVKLKEMLRFSLPLIIGTLSYWALVSIDRFFLKYESTYNELALYSVAAILASGVGVLVTVFSNLWHPIVYKWISEGIDKEKILLVNECMVVVVCFLWSLIGVFAWSVVYIFPSVYSDTRFLVVSCVAMPLLYMLSETTTVGIGLSRKTIYSMLASFLALIFNMVINYLFVKEYGAKAATIASMSAFTLFLILRTEFSSLLWVSLPRWKMYFSIMLYYVITFFVVFEKFENVGVEILAWIMAFILVLILYSKRISQQFKRFKLREVKC
ncbi:lipopolysaccharide biosynthesis protein [Acinetobacter bereziniae]|uniref:lipopolysaccharide biosynthesis protein n=1 Tax=Acinetobacter bereziniae TaxID=106648 RepID=UPI0021CEB9AD|nr:oligosaccharide flippase family protein [Acinetobacter bereziniae]MCU4418139.1 oligosaccharide flippase family protein [Acinetobacter bereziniae]